MVKNYLLDTNVWIHYLKFAGPIEAKLRVTPANQILVCSVVRAELLHGARKYGKPEEREARVMRTLSPYRSLPFDDRAARSYARIRHELEIAGQIIGPNDLFIAAIADAHRLTLVTSNREFSRIDGLLVEDWLKTDSPA